jgi:hypothetical protein
MGPKTDDDGKPFSYPGLMRVSCVFPRAIGACFGVTGENRQHMRLFRGAGTVENRSAGIEPMSW